MSRASQSVAAIDRSTGAPATLIGGGAERAEARPDGKRPWRRYFRTTREGKAFIFVTGGVGFAAINTGNNLLFLIFGFMLSLIVLSGVMSEIALRKLSLERRLPRRAFAQATTLVEVALSNKKRRAPSYSLEVEDLAEGTPTERRCYFLKVAAGAQQVASYRRVPRHRGILKLSGFRVATRYPFGIIEKWRLLPAPDELLVYPALLSDELVESELRGVGLDSPSNRRGPGSEVAGLRAFRQDDEARSIHWRRSAALGRLVVFERHRDDSTHLSILLDNAQPPGLAAEELARWQRGFEHAISRATTFALAALARDLSVDVLVRGERSSVVMPGNPPDPVLRFLALLPSVAEQVAQPLQEPTREARVVRLAVRPLFGPEGGPDGDPEADREVLA